MQPPEFWQNSPTRPGGLAALLWPLSMIWKWQTRRRLARGAWRRVGVPVICVGNATLGGSGKTPTVMALVALLKDKGYSPHVVTRGFGGSLPGPTLVQERFHTARQVGDEPLLLAAFCNTWVSRDRHAGAQAAAHAGADVILLDDGFQNPGLAKDVSILVVDAQTGFGNGRVVPSGPLRESVADAVARADIVLLVGNSDRVSEFSNDEIRLSGRQVMHGEIKPLDTGMVWRGQKVLAFAGIARPAKFFATLQSLGADVVQTEALSDHQVLTPQLMHRLQNQAFALDAQLVTTEKDAVRLPIDLRTEVLTLPVRMVFGDTGALVDLLIKKAGIMPPA